MNSPAAPALSAGPVRRPLPWLRLLVAAQVLVLLGIAGLALATDRWGQTVVLRTRPADPRDILYGDYVRLDYDISQLAASLWRGPGPLPTKGQAVWVLLRPATPAWQPVGIYRAAPSAAPGQAALQAQVETSWTRRLNLRYGLERYYLPEGTGRRLEAATRDSSGLLVRVQVAPWGTVRLGGVAVQ
jgi:uncharacterized membrane-anchored protein